MGIHLNYGSDIEKTLVESAARILALTAIRAETEENHGRLGIEWSIRKDLSSNVGKDAVVAELTKAMEAMEGAEDLQGTVTASHVRTTLRLAEATDPEKMASEMPQEPDWETLDGIRREYFSSDIGKEALRRIAESDAGNTCVSYHDIEACGAESFLRSLGDSAHLAISLENALKNFRERRYWCGKMVWVCVPMLPTAILSEEKEKEVDGHE